MLSGKTLQRGGPGTSRLVVTPILVLALAISAGLVSSCGGSLYRVKPVAELPSMPDSAATANLGSVTFRAMPLLSDEENQELFEANLQLAGLLPVRVELFITAATRLNSSPSACVYAMLPALSGSLSLPNRQSRGFLKRTTYLLTIRRRARRLRRSFAPTNWI